ncbi:WD40 repeat domain-containing protein [Promicromonospora kroppenstedtii]|uniref:WD40 repeat domain-containing protein n=1 Tax=Promicromonospora kroppenstedtii TaxID=440482 RepID=A0ABW7XK28_9MICO
MDGGGQNKRFDAFVSYSHTADAAFSRVLHRELEGFGRTNRRDRPLEIFRDESYLAAGRQLTPEIQSALGRSEWLLLLASPAAARSRWVNQELDWWWDRHGTWERLLVAVTDGEVGWSAAERDRLGERSAIPPALADRLEGELIWQDLRGLSRAQRFDSGAADVRMALAGLAAPLRGVPKADLIGFHVEWQRGEIRRGRRVAIALGAASVALALAAGAAFLQGRAAAESNVTANARLLSNAALAVADTDDERAKLLAVEGYRLHEDAQTTSALYQAAGANVYRSAQVPLPGPMTSTAQHASLTASGTHVVAATTEGLVLWDTHGATTEVLGLAGEEILDVAVGGDGTVVAAATPEAVTVWRDGRAFDVAAENARVGVDDSHLVVVESEPFSERPTRMRVIDTSDGSVVEDVKRHGVPSADEIGVDDGVVTIASELGTWQRRPLDDLGSVDAEGDQALAPMNGVLLALAPNARYFGFASYDLRVFPNYTGRAGAAGGGFHPTDPLPITTDNDLRVEDVPAAYVPQPLTSGNTTAFAISGTGDRYLVAGGDEIWVTSLRESLDGPARWRLTGARLPDAAVFLSNNRVVTVDHGSITLWNLSARPEVYDELDLVVQDGPTAGFSATLAASDDGERIAAVGGFGQMVIDDGTRTRTVEAEGYWPLWRRDGSLLIASTIAGYVLDGERVTELWLDDQETDTTSWGLFGAWVVGDRLILVDGDHDVQVRDAETGRLLRRIDTDIPEPEEWGRDTSIVNSAALSPDGTTVGIATADERGAYLVDLGSGRTRALRGEGVARGILMTDEAVIVVRPQQVDVLDATGAELRRVIPMEGDFVHAVAMVPGTSLVARVRNDGHLVLFDTGTGDEMGSFPMPSGGSSGVNWPWATATLTVAGESILSASANAPIARWDLTPGAVVDAACRAAGRDLRPEEWSAVASLDPPDDLSCGRDREPETPTSFTSAVTANAGLGSVTEP